MGLIIVFVFAIILIISVIYANKQYSKKEGIALLFVSSSILDKSIDEDKLLTEHEKRILSNEMGIHFDKDIITFQDIKNSRKVSYFPYSHWTSWYIVKFNNKNEVIAVKYIENKSLYVSKKNEIGIKVKS